MGLSRFELLTPRLSSVCSNQLSYRPFWSKLVESTLPRSALPRSARPPRELVKEPVGPILSKLDRRACLNDRRTYSNAEAFFRIPQERREAFRRYCQIDL